MACDLKKKMNALLKKKHVLVKEMDGIRLEMIWPPCSGPTYKSRNISRAIYFEMGVQSEK